MKITANIFISNDGSLRFTKKYTGASARELAVQLVIDVPDVFFNRPMPIVHMSIPEEFLLDPSKEVAVKWIAPNIADALKVEVKTIEDGLLTALKNQVDPTDQGGKDHTEQYIYLNGWKRQTGTALVPCESPSIEWVETSKKAYAKSVLEKYVNHLSSKHYGMAGYDYFDDSTVGDTVGEQIEEAMQEFLADLSAEEGK